MTPRLLRWAPPVLAMTLFAAASAVVGIYYGDTRAISYTTPVSWQLLWQHRGGLSVSTLREAWSTGPYDLAFILTVLAWPLLLRRRAGRTAWVAGALPILLLCPVNLLGALDAVVELVLRPGWDGETLGEGWPLLNVYGLWSLWSAGFLVYLWRTRDRAGHQSAPWLIKAPQNNEVHLTRSALALRRGPRR